MKLSPNFEKHKTKIVALKDHKCYFCGETIKKGEECIALFVNPSNLAKNEFDVIYTYLKCFEEEACRVRREK